MINTGVNVSLQGNVKEEARAMSEGLDAVARSADSINAAFDPRLLDEYSKKITDIINVTNKLETHTNRQNQQQANRARQMQNMFSSATSSMVQAGRGNVGGAALAGGKGLAGLLGGPAALVAGIGLAGGMATNALADAYSGRATPAQRIATLQGQMSTDMEANTAALRAAMAETVQSVSKYGKSYEEGARAQETFLRAGGRDFAGSRIGAYSVAYGTDMGGLAAFTGMGERYGQRGGLGATRALLMSQGLGTGQFEEVMGGMQDAFSSFLSQGITKSFEDIARSQEFFSRAGATFKGGLGAQKLQGMNQVVAGAGSLQNRSDLFLYRAASQMTGGDILETKKLLEQGMTPEMFQGLMGEFDRFGYGRTEGILQLSKMFGLSTTAAEQVYGLKGQKITNAGLETAMRGGLPEDTGMTTEAQYAGTVEGVKQAIAGVAGGKAFDLRAGALGLGGDLIGQFGKIGDSVRAEEIHAETIKVARIQVEEGFSSDVFGAEVYNPAKSLAGVRPGYSEFVRQVDAARAAGVSESDLYSISGEYKSATSRKGPGRGEITGEELSTLSGLLQDLIVATKDTTAAVREDVVLHGAIE